MVFNSFFDATLGPLIRWHPLYGLIVISFILTLIITLIYKWLTDQEKIKTIKKEMKDHQEEMKNNKNNPEKMVELQKLTMEKSLKLMTMSLKPTLITLIPIVIIFGWLRVTYNPLNADPLPLNFIGIHSWIWVYIIFSILFSVILRKILKVH